MLCDVVRMDATHLLLGRPWQFDRRVLHDGFLNTYLFTFHGKRVTLYPLSPQEILQDTAERARLKALEEDANKGQPHATSSTSPPRSAKDLRRGEAALRKDEGRRADNAFARTPETTKSGRDHSREIGKSPPPFVHMPPLSSQDRRAQPTA